MVERHNAFIRSALQRAGSRVIKELLCISSTAALGLAIYMHNAIICSNNNTSYQALVGRRPHLLPPLEGGYHGDLDAKGQIHIHRVREIVSVAITEATAKQRFVRGSTRNQVVSIERSEHQPGDLVDIWYDPPNADTFVWRGPAQIAAVNGSEGNVPVRFQGKTLDRRHQEVRTHVPYLVYLPAVVEHKHHQWDIAKRDAENMSASFMTVGAVRSAA